MVGTFLHRDDVAELGPVDLLRSLNGVDRCEACLQRMFHLTLEFRVIINRMRIDAANGGQCISQLPGVAGRAWPFGLLRALTRLPQVVQHPVDKEIREAGERPSPVAADRPPRGRLVPETTLDGRRVDKPGVGVARGFQLAFLNELADSPVRDAQPIRRIGNAHVVGQHGLAPPWRISQPWLSLHASADATVVMAATTLSTAVPHGPYWAQRHRQAAGRHLDCRNCRTYGHARNGTSAAR